MSRLRLHDKLWLGAGLSVVGFFLMPPIIGAFVYGWDRWVELFA